MKKVFIVLALGFVFSITSCTPEVLNDETTNTTTIDDGEITDDDI